MTTTNDPIMQKWYGATPYYQASMYRHAMLLNEQLRATHAADQRKIAALVEALKNAKKVIQRAERYLPHWEVADQCRPVTDEIDNALAKGE